MAQMIRIGICDDEFSEAVQLQKIVEAFFARKKIKHEIKISSSGETLLKNAESYQIVLLDIEFQGDLNERNPFMNGIGVAQKLRERNKKAEIFFITNHEKYRLAAVCTHYFYYLRKPVTKTVFEPLLQEAFEYIYQKRRKCSFELVSGHYAIFDISDIIFFKAENKSIVVCMKDKLVRISSTLESVAEKLKEDFTFINRSCLINLEHIIENNNNITVVMRNGTVLKVAVRREKMFGKIFREYLERLS